MPNADEKKPAGMVDVKMLATLFKLTVRRVQQLTQDGILRTDIVNKQRRYNLIENVQRYIEYLRAKAESREGKQDDAKNESRKIEAEADLKEAKARVASLEAQELEGKLHRSEDVEDMTTQLVFTIRSLIVALPGRLAVDLAQMDKPAEVSHRIKRETDSILSELSKFKYDPETYRKLVRGRKGWSEMISEDEGDGE